MKNKVFAIARVVLILLTVALALVITACKETTPDDTLWQGAIYTEDVALGDGEKRITVKVTAGEHAVTFTLRTDGASLEDVMLEHGLVEGEDGPYGLYIKKVNGILADYDADATYWTILENGSMAATGASGIMIEDGGTYEFKRTK